MAKLRRNHGKGKRGSGFGVSLLRLGVILGLFIVALVLLYPVMKKALTGIEQDATGRNAGENEKGINRLYLPTGPSDQVIHHAYYSLGYDNDWEQPRWVAYRLTPKQVKNRKVKRTDDFRPDPAIEDGSAERDDYRRSGYTRGHLVPAGDMGFDRDAMSQTFFYSNMSPQLSKHNGGVWRELEETTREWIKAKGPSYIVSGPVVSQRPKRIGKNAVAIPSTFYRVILTESGEGIGFLIPHEMQTARLEKFAVSIDKVEEVTGLDFFVELPNLASPIVEANVDKQAWVSSDRRYQQRLNSWNKR